MAFEQFYDYVGILRIWLGRITAAAEIVTISLHANARNEIGRSDQTCSLSNMQIKNGRFTRAL